MSLILIILSVVVTHPCHFIIYGNSLVCHVHLSNVTIFHPPLFTFKITVYFELQ